MKTLQYLRSKSVRFSLALAASLLLAASFPLLSQEVSSLLGSGAPTRYCWGIEMKSAEIQNEFATQCGIYTGAVFNNSVMAGMVGALNVTHPRVNFGYLGLFVKYIYKPAGILHMSGQLTLGSASTRDYENEKTNTFDNFGNVSGAGFYFIEPVINAEINLDKKTKLIFGLGYRFASGINPDNRYISSTHISDKDFSGITVTAAIAFGPK
jgi:hypothetical protein